MRNYKIIAFAHSLFLLLIILIFASVFFINPISSISYKIGQFLGTLSITFLAIQIFLSSRNHLIEKFVGYDLMIVWHKKIAKLTFLSVALHPLFIFLKEIVEFKFNILLITKSFTIYHYFGSISFILMIVIVTTSIFTHKLKISYEFWKLIHRLTYLIILFSLIHLLNLSSHFILYDFYKIYIYLLIFVIAFSFFYRNVYKNIFRKYKFKIIKIINESDNVTTLILENISKKIFNYFPGQFVFVNIFSKKISKEEHHFTISSAPSDKNISLTIKSVGDYTKDIKNLKPGNKVLVEGPYGVFSNYKKQSNCIFIAGGIGITPIRSMIRSMYFLNSKEKSILLYSAKDEKDLIFKKEFDSYQKKGFLKCFYLLSQSKNTNYINGRIDENILKKVLKEFANPEVYICGPYEMSQNIKSILNKLGVSKSKIFSENFFLK